MTKCDKCGLEPIEEESVRMILELSRKLFSDQTWLDFKTEVSKALVLKLSTPQKLERLDNNSLFNFFKKNMPDLNKESVSDYIIEIIPKLSETFGQPKLDFMKQKATASVKVVNDIADESYSKQKLTEAELERILPKEENCISRTCVTPEDHIWHEGFNTCLKVIREKFNDMG